MKVKTSKLTGAALRWAVAEAEWKGGVSVGCLIGQQIYCYDDGEKVLYEPDTNWAQGGPIIDCHGINIGTQRNEPGFRPHPDFMWHAQMDTRSYVGYGPTPLISAMRCYVASKLGDEVDVPNELVK